MKIIHDIEQGSPEWFALRLGSIGGSSIGQVVAGGKGKTRTALMYRLAGELLSGQPYEGFVSDHMRRGIALEAEARDRYMDETLTAVQQVALFQYGPHQHYSPDGDMPEEGGILEVKCPTPAVHVETIHRDAVPAQYVRQVQWGLREREWCGFVSYCPAVADRPLYIKRMERDAKLIGELEDGADRFVEEMLAIVEQVR